MSLGAFYGKSNAIFILPRKGGTYNFSKDLINYLSICYNEQRHPYRIKNVDEDEDAMASGPLDVQINAIMMMLCLAFRS